MIHPSEEYSSYSPVLYGWEDTMKPEFPPLLFRANHVDSDKICKIEEMERNGKEIKN
jgi:hypothetical protein